MKKLKNFQDYILETSKYLKHAAFLKANKETEENISDFEKRRKSKQAFEFSKNINPIVKKRIEDFLQKFVNTSDSKSFSSNIKKEPYIKILKNNDVFCYIIKVSYLDRENKKEGFFSVTSENYEEISDELKKILNNSDGASKQFSRLLKFIKEDELIHYTE